MSLQEAPRAAAGERRSFGDVLKQYRRAAGLTQEALAERAGLSVRGISDLERGVNRAPRLDTLQLLAVALTLSAQERALFESLAPRPGDPSAPFAHRVNLPPGRAASQSGPLPREHPEPPAGPTVPPFVGRERELALLAAHLAGHGPPLLLLAGQPGIGKSRLLQRATEQTQAAGWRVLVGGCQRGGGQGPYAPLLEALERYIDGQSSLRLRAALRGCAWLVRLLPELAAGPIEPLPSWQVSAEHERRLMFRAVARFLANIAGPAGTLLVLDDLQWAGADALGLLTALLRADQGAPLRILGAYRETEVSPTHPLALLLADLAPADLVQQRAVEPLGLAEARALLAALLAGQEELGPGAAEQVLERTGGVPYFVVSWARGLQAGAGASQAAAVPWTLSQSIRQRVAALPAMAQEVLASAAVLGRVVARPVLLGMGSLAAAEAVAGIEAACRARLLEEAGETAYRFVHDVIREVIESDLGSARRAALHRRAGEALEAAADPAAVEALAYHFARADVPGRAVVYLEQAAERARARYAHEAAAAYYRELVAMLDRMGRPDAAVVACEKLGAALITLLRYGEALEALERAAAHHAAGGASEALGRVTAQIAFALTMSGAPAEGLARIRPLLEPLEARGPSPALADLYFMRSVVYGTLYLWQEELATATRAVELARAVRDDQLLARAVGRQGYALISAGRVAESLETLEEARRRAESLDDLYALYLAHNHASLGHYALGDLRASMRCAEQALDAARRFGDPQAMANALAYVGRSAFLMGDWSRARADLERALELVLQSRYTHAFLATATFLGECHLAAGEWDEATRYLHEVVAAAGRSTANHGRLRHAQGLLAEHDLYCGRPQAARDRLLPLTAAENTFAPWLRTQLAWAYLELGEAELAAATVARALTQSRAEQHRVRLVEELRVQAMVLVRLGHGALATAALDEGLALAPTLPYPYGEARLLAVYGRLHARQGQPEPARARLPAALAIFRRLGARKDLERTEQVLASLS